MRTFHFRLPEFLSTKDVLAKSTNVTVLFEPPGAFVPATIAQSDGEESVLFSVSVEDVPRARDSQETEKTATLFLMKGDKKIAEIPLLEHEC